MYSFTRFALRSPLGVGHSRNPVPSIFLNHWVTLMTMEHNGRSTKAVGCVGQSSADRNANRRVEKDYTIYYSRECADCLVSTRHQEPTHESIHSAPLLTTYLTLPTST